MSTVFRPRLKLRTYFGALETREQFTFESNSPPGTFVKVDQNHFAIPAQALTTGPQKFQGLPTTNTGRVKWYVGARIPETAAYRRVIRVNPPEVMTEANGMRDW